jgi:hypothetical protein
MPTKNEDRHSRANVFIFGALVAVALTLVAVFGPSFASRFFPGDGTGAPGNLEHERPVAQKTNCNFDQAATGTCPK